GIRGPAVVGGACVVERRQVVGVAGTGVGLTGVDAEDRTRQVGDRGVRAVLDDPVAAVLRLDGVGGERGAVGDRLLVRVDARDVVDHGSRLDDGVELHGHLRGRAGVDGGGELAATGRVEHDRVARV